MIDGRSAGAELMEDGGDLRGGIIGQGQILVCVLSRITRHETGHSNEKLYKPGKSSSGAWSRTDPIVSYYLFFMIANDPV